MVYFRSCCYRLCLLLLLPLHLLLVLLLLLLLLLLVLAVVFLVLVLVMLVFVVLLLLVMLLMLVLDGLFADGGIDEDDAVRMGIPRIGGVPNGGVRCSDQPRDSLGGGFGQ